MNCDDFLPALETGGPLRRFRARRHAARCPRCAAVAARFAAVKVHWAAAPAPSARQRLLWERAASTAPAVAADRQTAPHLPRRRMSWPLAAGLAAAAACALVVVAIFVGREPDQVVVKPPPETGTTQPGPVAGPVETRVLDATAVLAGLTDDVERLGAEMHELRRQAERAEAREQVALVLARFEQP